MTLEEKLKALIDMGLTFALAVDVFAERADETDGGQRVKYRDLAQAKYDQEGTCEIDWNAQISWSSDGGAYVMSWLWVDDPEDEEA